MLGELPSEFDPELQGRKPEHVWNGHWTYGYPLTFDFGFTVLISGQRQIYEGLGRYLHIHQLIPQKGNILDVGCGPSSHYIFGEELTKKSVFGVDYAPAQLEKSKIPPHRQIEADLREEHLPDALTKQKFSLITSFLAARYLNDTEASRLYRNLRPLGETLVVADVHGANPRFERVLGQQRKFTSEREKELLEEAGYTHVQTTPVFLPRSDGSPAANMVWGQANESGNS